MTLEDLGNVGEFVAAIGVVVSLIYLARQIRQNTAQISQNTQSVKLSSLEANVQSGNRVRELLIESAQLSELYIKGLQGYSRLDRPERLRFGMLLQNLLGTLQAAYIRTALLGLEPALVEEVTRMLDSMFSNAGVREWWDRRQGDWRPEFREIVNERLALRGRGNAA